MLKNYFIHYLIFILLSLVGPITFFIEFTTDFFGDSGVYLYIIVIFGLATLIYGGILLLNIKKMGLILASQIIILMIINLPSLAIIPLFFLSFGI